MSGEAYKSEGGEETPKYSNKVEDESPQNLQASSGSILKSDSPGALRERKSKDGQKIKFEDEVSGRASTGSDPVSSRAMTSDSQSP